MSYDEAREASDSPFEMKTAAEWMSEAADEPPPQMLFDEMWQTGEIAVMFAGPGCGKSLLAVQIAESIAHGTAVEPFEMTAPPQKVLYVDLEHTAGQFRARYAGERAASKSGGKAKPAKTHAFSDNFLRVSLKGGADIRAAMLGPVIEQSGARVVIIDSIAHLQRYQIPRETAVVMRELRQLRDRYGLSILVITHSPRNLSGRVLSAGDMACPGVMANFADNIFAIGQCRSRSAVRYIKHVKAGSSPLAFGRAHLPHFSVVGGAFPRFEFGGYSTEEILIESDGDKWEWDTIRQIKALSDRGHTIRNIADDLGLSRSTVHRFLKMAPPPTPPAPPPELKFYMFEKCIYDRCKGCGTCRGRAARYPEGAAGHHIKGHDDCPDDCDICGPLAYSDSDTTVNSNLKRLSDRFYEELRQWLIEGKRTERPKYPGARRYGVQAALWYPGSETWTDEETKVRVRRMLGVR